MRTIFICILTFLSTTILAQQKWSLEKCINHAKENNITILKQKIQNESVKKDITAAKGNYLPDVSFSTSQNYSLGNSFNISTGVGQKQSSSNSFNMSSSLSLFNGLSNKYQLEKAHFTVGKSEFDLANIALDLSLNILNKYLQVLFNKEILKIATLQEKKSEQEVKRIKQLYKATLKPKREWLEMAANLASDKKQVIIAKNNLENSFIVLKELLDIEQVKDFDVEDFDMEEFGVFLFSVEDVYKESLLKNPLLKSTEMGIRIKQKGVEIAQSNYYPSLSFSYSYSTNYYHILGEPDVIIDAETGEEITNGFKQQFNNNLSHFLGFTLRIPIFNRFQTSTNIAKSEIELQIVKKELQNQQKELKNKIEIAYNNMLTAKATLDASKVALLLQEEIFSITEEKYNQGIISTFEYLESKFKYRQVQSEQVRAKYDYLFKVKILEYYH